MTRYIFAASVRPPPQSLERIQNASPPSASKLASSADPGPKTLKPSSSCSSNRSPARNLWRGLFSALLCLALLFGLAAPAQAQQELISNIGQTGNGTASDLLNFNYAQSFTTGGNELGYTLSSVDLVFERTQHNDLFRTNNPRFAVTIQNESGGVPGTTVLGTLTLPSSSPSPFVQPSTFRFAAPGNGIRLEPLTTYFVVLGINTFDTGTSLQSINSNAENEGGADGFSIGDSSYSRANSNFGWSSWQWEFQIGINGTVKEATLPKPFTPTQFLSLSLTSGDGRCTYQNADLTYSEVTGPQYDCVRATSVNETDSAPVNVEFYVRTSQTSSSALPFRVCFSGTATRRTGGNAEQDDYLVQERVDSAWQTRNSTCVDSSIAANQLHRKLRIQVLGDDHYEEIPMWVDGQERLVISGTEWVGVQLVQDPGKQLPSPYGINSGRDSLGVTINDDDYSQQPLAFGTWAGKPGVKEGRPSLDQDVGIPFSAQAGWETTVTYRVVRGHESGGSTAIYGTDYRLRGGYNRNTNRGTMTLAKGKSLASLPITVIEDTLIEGTETVVLEMVDTGTHEVAKPNRVTIYIGDDEATPLLKVDESGTVLRDGVDSGHRIKMSLTPAHSSIPDRTLPVDAHFEYCVTSSATLGDDYTLVRPDGTKVTTTGCHLATLPKGELSTYLDLKLFDDGRSDEPNESVKIRLQRSTVAGKETTDLLEIPDSTRTADETISTVITIKDDLPVLKVLGYDDTSKRDRRYRAIFTIHSVNGALPTDLYVKWEVEDTGNVVNDNRKQSLGKSGYKTLTRGFSEFTVTIGIRHDAGPGTVTFKLTPASRPFRLAPGDNCVGINGGRCPVGNNAPAIQAPDTAVSNLQVAAVDDASASVTWDAVAHATSYDVSWDGSGSQTAVSGVESVTGTTVTIQHNAEEAMTLTVTVTPEYVDGNGQVVSLPSLAGTAMIDVGPRPLGDGGTNSGDRDSVRADSEAVDLPYPVAHWQFDNDAVDSVGSSDGTVNGGAAFTANEDGSGVGSHALSLDGSDDHVNLSSHVSSFPLGDATRSVSGWFKADAGSQGQTFLSYGPNVAGKRFSIAADRTQTVVGVSDHAWGVNGLDLSDGWHHIAVTYAGGDSDDILIYLDGELQSASTLAGSSQRLDTRTGPAMIGQNVSGVRHYAGSIDDVRLYDVALSAEQVRALFEEHPQTVLAEDNLDEPEPSEQIIEADDEEADDVAVDLPDPVAHWDFDNNAVDGAGSSHGTVSGGAAFVANEDGEGVGSHALSLDGSNDYVDLDLHVSKFPLGDSTRSVTGWFKADAGNQDQTFFAYGPNVAGKRFSIAADRTQAVVGVSGYAWGVRNLSLTDGWHHIAVTFAGGDAKVFSIYLDGVLQSAELLGGFRRELDTKSGPASIGRSATGTKHYAGSIDDVRLYDVELSAEQVRALFDEHPQL